MGVATQKPNCTLSVNLSMCVKSRKLLVHVRHRNGRHLHTESNAHTLTEDNTLMAGIMTQIMSVYEYIMQSKMGEAARE